MTTSSLRAVTAQTVANYAQAAERAVGAYRVGGHRLIAALQRSVDLAAQNGPERLASALRRAGGNVGGLAGRGLDVVSRRTERAIEIGSTGMTRQLRRVADLVDGVDIPVVSNGLHAAARISLPGAQAALALSQRVAAGADKLPGSPVAVAGAKLRAGLARTRKAAPPKAGVEAAVVAVVKQVRKRAAKAGKAAAPVVAELQAEVKPRATRKATTQPAIKPALQGVAKPAKAVVKAATTRVRRAAKAKPVAAAVAAVQDAIAA